MEALRIYSSSAYTHDIESLIVIFTEPGESEEVTPPGPKEEVRNDAKGGVIVGEDGAPIVTISKSQETIYNERIKQWIRNEKSL